MHRQDAARVLEVANGATAIEVDRAFRIAARAAHPDLHPAGSPAQRLAASRMHQLLEARAVLRSSAAAPAVVRPRSPHAGWATTTARTTTPTAAPTTGSMTGTPGRSSSSATAPALRGTSTYLARDRSRDGRPSRERLGRRHASLRSIDAYRRVRSSALLWLALLLGAALACTEAARLDPGDGLLPLGATLLAVAALASLAMAARAHVALHATVARAPA